MMLEHSFIHLPGIGEQTERKLWDQGLRHWDDLESVVHDVFGAKKASAVAAALEESRLALESDEFQFFQERMKGAHVWRLLPRCRDSIAFLDIETTGLGFPPASHSTSIAITFRGELFVEHEHEKKRELLERIENEAKLLVTFNGLCFDMPFLRHEFGRAFAMPHLDLRVWFRRLGFTGGLKRIQQGFSEVPQRDSMDIDGFDAVRLWRMHQRGMPNALETLMSYNAEDTVVLEALMYLAYAREREAHSHLPLPILECPVLPEIPMKVCPRVYAILRGEEAWPLPKDW
jgi:uncharacterized protein YprB with RNaseH-like and TPR domain